MPKFTESRKTEEKKPSANLETIVLQVLRNWWLILIGTLISVMLFYVIVTETYHQKYSSTATFVVSGKGSVTSTMLTDIDTAKSMTQAFAYALSSDILMEKVEEAVGIDEFTGKVETSQLPETNILSLTVTADTPELAFDVINAIIENHHVVTDSMIRNAAMYVLMKPTVPKAPVSPINRRSRVITYSLAAMFTIIAGIVLSTVFSKKIFTGSDFDNKVGGLERLASFDHESSRRRSRLPLFIKRQRNRSGSLLVSNPTTSFSYTETFRLLQTRLQALMKNRGYKTLMITGVEEDEGRSTVAANLALTFARENKRVLLVEADMREASLAKILDCEKDLTVSIDEYIIGERGGELLPTPDYAKNLSLLICKHSVPDFENLLISARMQSFMEEAAKYFDYIVIDTPPIAVSSAAEYCAESCDAAVMVVRRGFASAPRIESALSTLSASTEVLGYVMNDMVHLPLFGSGAEAGGTGYDRYGRYGRYGKYGRYGRGYGNYGRYGKYGPGGYGHYGSYGSGDAQEAEPSAAAEPAEYESYERRRPSAAERKAQAARENAAREDAAPAEDADESMTEEPEIDIGKFLVDTFRTFFRIFWLPLGLAVLLSAILCLKLDRNYSPRYTSSATFTISAVGVSGTGAEEYNKNVTKRLSRVFPHVLTSGILNDLICEDLQLKRMPASLAAHVEGETTLFTLEATARKPENALMVLESAIRKYPQITNFVIGNTNMTLLREPTLPSKPINPKNYAAQIAVGTSIAVLIGLAAAIIINMTRRTVGGTQEIRDILSVRCIGTLPFERTAKEGRQSPILSIQDSGISKDFTDSINLICRRLIKSADEHDEKVILFAGSIPGEGKSTVALNTAYALAASGKMVVFIDCDIRKPSTISELPEIREKGLVEYLRGEADIGEIVSRIAENLYAIRGSKKNYNAPELLRSEKMRRLVEAMAQNADFVIFDTPPSAILADSQILSEFADCAVYVVCQDYTMKNSLIAGVNNLANTGIRFMGYVLNNAGSTDTGYSYGKHRSSGYGSYGGYGKYGKYGGRGKYGNYGGYGKYGKYGSYGKYGKYGRYGSYGGYGNYGNEGPKPGQTDTADSE